jgi:hypothetical protein
VLQVVASTFALLLPVVATSCLPVGYAGSLGGYGGVYDGKATSGEAGGEASFHFYPQGSRGAALTADVGGTGASPGLAARTGIGAGYAYVPRPFEGHWGYELLARGGLGNVAGDGQLALHAGARFALLFRVGQDDTVWHQDESPTAVLWFVGPLVDIEPATPSSWAFPWIDGVVGVAVYAVHYSIGAP